MPTLLIIAIAAGVLGTLLVLDAAARWNLSSSLVLTEYDRLLREFREREEARLDQECNVIDTVAASEAASGDESAMGPGPD